MGSFTLGCTDTPFLATCRCPTCVGHEYQHDSLDSGVQAVFFFFFSLLRCSVDMPTMGKKKNQDFDRWTNPYHWFCDIPLSEKWEVRKNQKPTQPNRWFPLTRYPLHSVSRRHYIGQIGELPLSLPISLSLSVDRSELLSISRFLFFFFFFLLFADCFGPLVWCTVACYIYNTQSFFFFF